MSSKRAPEWETPPPTPQMPAASAGAAAVAVPGKEKHSTESHTDLYTDDLSPLINYISLNFTGS